MPFITQGKTNFKYLAIVLIVAVLVGAGIFLYQQDLDKKTEIVYQSSANDQSVDVLKDQDIKDILPAGASIEVKTDEKIIKNIARGYEISILPYLVVRTNEAGAADFYGKEGIINHCVLCPSIASIFSEDNLDNLTLDQWMEKMNKEYGFLYWDEKEKVSIYGYSGYKIKVEGDPANYYYYFAEHQKIFYVTTLTDVEIGKVIKNIVFN